MLLQALLRAFHAASPESTPTASSICCASTSASLTIDSRESLEKCSDKAKAAFANIHGTPSAVEKASFDQVLGMLTKSASQNAAASEGDSNADHH